MKLFLLCIVLFPFGVFSQTKTEIVSYDVQVRLNENDNSISGKIIVSLSQIVNSDFNYIFLTPKGWNIHSIEDTEENSFDVELVRTDNTNVGQYQVELPSSFNINDTLRMVIDFTAMLDTVSSKNVFVNKKEFVLSQSDTLSWLPNFGATNVHQYSFEFSTPTTWTIFAEEPMDTIYTEGLRMWKRSNRNIASLSSAFALYGINNASIHTAFGSDSLAAVSFYSQPEKFNQQYAAALVKQLQEAFLFFSSLTHHTAQQMDFTVASIGTEHFDKPFFASKQLLILRNSPAYAVYDSLLLLRSQYNRWLTKLALQFTPQSVGASVLLREGFASYLAMRFLMVSQPEIEKNERLYSLSRALSFFSHGTLGGANIKKNEAMIQKGRYFFLMLEYLLGRETFDLVIKKMTARSATALFSATSLRSLCEEEYGSSLEWFFDQWLNRSSAPEFIMEWKSEKTPRGMSIVKVIIEQRGDNFSMPIIVNFTIGKRTQSKRIFVERSKQEFTFTFPATPERVDLDPNILVFRWLRELRIPAHAQTALQYLSIDRDIVNAEQEALYTLQLDPNNSTGSAVLANYVLGNIAAMKNDRDKAKEYFFQAMSSSSTSETEQYKILCLIRFGNIVELDGKREEALQHYQRALFEGKKNPVIFEHAIIEAEKYLREKFAVEDNTWFESF